MPRESVSAAGGRLRDWRSFILRPVGEKVTAGQVRARPLIGRPHDESGPKDLHPITCLLLGTSFVCQLLAGQTRETLGAKDSRALDKLPLITSNETWQPGDIDFTL